MSYIKRETAIEFVRNNVPHVGDETSMCCVERALKNVPSAEVVEVVQYKDCAFDNGDECLTLIEKACDECHFYKTAEQVIAGKAKAEKRLRRLPAKTKEHIHKKYYNGVKAFR